MNNTLTTAAPYIAPLVIPKPRQRDHTVAEMCRAFLRWSKTQNYSSHHQYDAKTQTRILLAGCPDLPLTRFGPKLLLQIQERLVEKGLCRDTVNRHVKGIRRIVRWAVSQEMAPGEVLYALQSVRGLRRGKTTAPDYPPVQPIDDLTVEKTLPFCGRIVAAMIRFEKLTGCRPGEVCSLRPCDVDQSGDVCWEYRPAHHKTMYLGRERVILIGPKAQAILAPFLSCSPDEFCFSAKEAVQDWRAGQRLARKTKVQPSQVDRSKRHPRRKAGLRYRRDSYSHAIATACRRAGVPQWHPNQLRHSAATMIRREFGLEAAQVLLGHAKADVTQVYAERDLTLAKQVAAKVG